MWALEPVYYLTFWNSFFFVFGGHKQASDVVVALEVHLDPQVVAGLLELIPKVLLCRHHYENVFVFGSLLLVLLCWSPSGHMPIVDVVLVIEFGV